MEQAESTADGFWFGLGIILTVLKLWLAAALILTALATGASEHPLAAVILPLVVAAAVAPFVRLGWFIDLRRALRNSGAPQVRSGLLVALVLAMAALWLCMGVFSALTTGTGLTQAMVPGPLAQATGALVVVASILGGIGLLRLRATSRAPGQGEKSSTSSGSMGTPR
ncbi:MAG: hypothetical protein AB7T37_16385 [Dehalococcoidia bacterium]